MVERLGNRDRRATRRAGNAVWNVGRRLVHSDKRTTIAPERQDKHPTRAEILAECLASVREMLVADVNRVPPDYLSCAYLARYIPGADDSWKSLLEELLRLSGFRTRYLLQPDWRRIQQPALLLWGEKDWFTPPSVGAQASAWLRDGQMQVLADAGHMPWLDDPEESTSAITRFLQEKTR